MKKVKRLVLPLLVGALFLTSLHMLDHLRGPADHFGPVLPRFRSGSLSFFALGHAALLSDLLMARGLSHFGAHQREGNPEVLSGLGQLFAQAFRLDPSNRELPLFGASILGGIHLRAALSLLELGMSRHPREWRFPEFAGFLRYYHAGDSLSAARYYEKASRLPGHPPFVPSISSRLYEESGLLKQAIGVLRNLAGESEDGKVRRGFEERVDQLEERLRQRRFRLPVRLREAQSATRLRVELHRFNPYVELETLFVLDFLDSGMKPSDCEQAIMLSVWRKWLGQELWVELHRAGDGRLLRSGEAVCGVLRGEAGQNLAQELLKSIRKRPLLEEGAPWEKRIGQVVTVCGFLQEARRVEGDLALFWREEGLPHLIVAAPDLPAFGGLDWRVWLKEHGNEKQAVSGLLTVDDQRSPVLLLLHPAQITACAPAR